MTSHPPTPQKQDWEEYAERNLRHEFQGTLGKERTDELWKWIESLISLSISQARKEEREKTAFDIVNLLDQLEEKQPEELKTDNWRNWKYIRNSIVDKYKILKIWQALSPKEGGKEPMTSQKQDWKERVREKYFKDYVADEEEARSIASHGMKNPWFQWWMKTMEEERSLSISQARKEERERIIESIESYMNDIQDNRGSLPSIIKMIEALSPKEGGNV